MTRKLYVFRHGETDAIAGTGVRYGDGAFDKLTEHGMHQAAQLGEFLSAKKIDICFSSPFERSVHTAQIAFATRSQVQITIMEELKECKYLPWATEPEKVQRSKDDYERACVAIRKILESGFDDIAISSHGGTTRAILKFFGHDIGSIAPGTCFCIESNADNWTIAETFEPSATKSK